MPYDEVVKGYEVAPDEYVVLDKEEVRAAAGDRGKVVELTEFVESDAIDPVFFERTYYVGSRDDEDAYRLLHAALERSGRAGIGRFTRKGETVKAPAQEEEPRPVPDLMAALERTLEDVRARGTAAGRGRDGGTDDLAALTRDELYEHAKRADVPGGTKMSKRELVDALSDD